MLARRRVALATVLVALGLVFVSANYAEARGAPRWLSRFLRAVSGRSAIPAPTAAPGDTIVLFGPKTMALGSGTSATFVERFVNFQSATKGINALLNGLLYLTEVTNILVAFRKETIWYAVTV